METLNINNIITIPGEAAYQSSSSNVNSVVLICLITEGAREEVKYFRYIKEQLVQHSDEHVSLIVINESLKGNDKHKSNPISRYEQLQDWREQNIPTKGIIGVRDESWIVCDRDEDSFTEEQFDLLLSKVKEEDLHLVVSNPTFQIWLLFHYEQNIDFLNLNDGSSSCDQKKRIEDELKLIDNHYSHGKLKMSLFRDHIIDAVANSEKYPTEIELLKSEVGTNFAMIVRKLMPWLFKI